ncbi:MAG TPA: hypothetical protein PL188_02605 [Candidatus Cloacimonadota bacterium]|nr:hypothetical protein [Candidatus Cloacimonadota bacterium]
MPDSNIAIIVSAFVGSILGSAGVYMVSLKTQQKQFLHEKRTLYKTYQLVPAFNAIQGYIFDISILFDDERETVVINNELYNKWDIFVAKPKPVFEIREISDIYNDITLHLVDDMGDSLKRKNYKQANSLFVEFNTQIMQIKKRHFQSEMK